MPQAQVMQSKGQYIQGSWVKGSSRILNSFNPANGMLLWQGNNASENDMVSACLSAHQTLSSWSSLSFAQRTHYAKEFAHQVEKRRAQIAQLISLETGKPLWESQTEVTAVIDKINLSIQAYHERTWPKETSSAQIHACLRFKPQGVVVVLGAFNFPAHLSNGHIVPALLAGNTILYKPSEQTPAVAELMVQCWHDSGLPAGVLNCLQGDATCGKFLLSQNIQGIYFTGSYSSGLSIHQQLSQRPEVILVLEMGGNNPLVIDEISNLNAAIYYTILSTLITAGQRCTCARRVIIPNSNQGDEFLKHFIKSCTSLRVGSFDNQLGPFMGPVISHAQAIKHLQTQKNL